MLDFILQTVLFLSLGTVIFLIGRAVPRLGEGEGEPGKVNRLLSKLPIHKYDAVIAGFLEKSLRKIRVFLLRVDNGVSGFLKKIKTGKGINMIHERKRFFFRDHFNGESQESDDKGEDSANPELKA